jgi:hypothetical protein
MPQFEMVDIAPESLDGFTVGYIMAMFWTSEAPGVTTEEWQTTEDHNEGSIPGDVGFADLAPDALAKIVKECAAFQLRYLADLAICYTGFHHNGLPYDEASAGHDFWLTRNGHGAGFWDRFQPGTPQNAAADRLSEVCRHVYSEMDCYLGDDGKVYI